MGNDTKIIPAILAGTYEDLAYTLNRVQDFASLIHIDVADGEFVTGKTAGPHDLQALNVTIPLEIHLMVNNPLDWVKWYDLPTVERILFHAESLDATEEVIAAIRGLQREPGLVLNPETPIEEVDGWVERVETVQLMTIHPGRQGSRLLPETLKKADRLRKRFPDLPLSIDGGVTQENCGEIAGHPVDRIIAGSAIVKADDPQLAYERLVAIAEGK